MKISFYMNCVSAHVLPLAKCVARIVGCDNFTYVSCNEKSESAQQVATFNVPFQVKSSDEAYNELDAADVLYAGQRDIELFELRWSKGLTTFYGSERWFKPIHGLPGSLRMLSPGYKRVVKRFVRWANTDPKARILAIGPWAKKDFLKMGVRADKLVPWGYFVEPSISRVERVERVEKTLRVLWVGRNLAWKRVIDIERAVTLANKKLISALQLHLQSTTQPITFTKLTGVTPSEVRAAMRSHDVYVLASNAEEGWGAALNEALEEGMNAIGTFEAGASAAILPSERLYHAGDIGALAKLLELEYLTFTGQSTKHDARCTPLPPCSIGKWTAEKGALRLLKLAQV